MGNVVPLYLARIVMHMYIMRNLRDTVERSCKLNSAQARVLCFLELNGDDFQVGKLAENLKLSPSLATKSIASLEASGYVERVDDQADRRAVYVVLTEKGKQVAMRLWEVQGEAIARDYHLMTAALKQNNQTNVETPYTSIYQGILSGDARSIFTLTEYYEDLSHTYSHHARLHDVSLNAYFILLILYQNENMNDEVSPGDLAMMLLLKKTVVSHALSELLSHGYVNCHRGHLDRRKNVVDLTSEGFALVSTVTPALYDDLLKVTFPETSEAETEVLEICADHFNNAMRKSFRP